MRLELNATLVQYKWHELLSSISIYCDLHAHSRKYNVFMYGCENRKKSFKYLTPVELKIDQFGRR